VQRNRAMPEHHGQFVHAPHRDSSSYQPRPLYPVHHLCVPYSLYLIDHLHDSVVVCEELPTE